MRGHPAERVPEQPRDSVLEGRNRRICYPSRRPEGFLRWTSRSQAGVLQAPTDTELTSDGVPATLEDKISLASRAHGTQSSRPPRPKPPCHRRRPGQHVRTGRPQQNLASTFGPAQYNPAAARRGRGLGAHGQGVGEQGGRRSPGRSPGRGHAAARPQSLSRRRLFVLGLAGPALLVSPIGSERAAGVCACAAAPPVPPRR